MKTIIDDVECTDENSDGSANGGTAANQNCLCTVNRNKTIILPKTIMIGMANIFSVGTFFQLETTFPILESLVWGSPNRPSFFHYSFKLLPKTILAQLNTICSA